MKTMFHPIRQGTIKIPVPDTTQQKDYSCGPSSLEAICKYFGVGKEDEWQYVEDLKMDTRIGSHPYQIKRTAEHYGLRVRDKEHMSIRELRLHLRLKRPVLLMIQAWGFDKKTKDYRQSYKGIWGDGHWVVAIGFDSKGILFEDPSLQAVRGYLSDDELNERWHDVGPRNRHLEHYGMAVWRPGTVKSAYTTRAERIA